MNIQDNISIGSDFELSWQTSYRDVRLLRMIWVNRGHFIMGSPPNEIYREPEEEHQFESIISDGFWLSQYPTTNAQANTVMSQNEASDEFMNYPIVNINWYGAMIFAWELNRKLKDKLPNGYYF